MALFTTTNCHVLYRCSAGGFIVHEWYSRRDTFDTLSSRVPLLATTTLQSHYCRAMLCISATYDVVRCPFGWVSVTFVYCVETAKDIVVAMECE